MRYLLVCCLLLLLSVGYGQEAQLLIFGGTDHKTFLGCLNCNDLNPESIWNEYGTFGNSYNPNCIWNGYGSFGSAYSDLSPFNSYANHPPVIVDRDGDFYGYFTINQYRPKRADFNLANIIYNNYELIPKDASGWYKKIFD